MRDTVPALLRAARQRAGMTQDQAAEACGIDRRTISAYETGSSAPSMSAARRLADAYRMSAEDRGALLEVA